MDDREIVAAITAGDLDALGEAYDQYAESLFGYCYWMLSDPDDAADAVQDTFVIAEAGLRDLSDPRKLRPWLYAVARNECYSRLGAAEPGPDEEPDPGDADDNDERAELRRLVRAALDGLTPGEREVIELDLRHDLHGADLAAVLGVSRNQAHALASRARDQLEKALGVLLVAMTGRRACAELDLMLDGWDGRMTVLTRKRVSTHIGGCDLCASRQRGVLRRATLYGMAPLAALPYGLREEVLDLCADDSPEAQSYRQEVLERTGSFRPNGFPEPVRAPRSRLLALSGVAAAVGVVIAVVATGVVTVLALSGSHARHPAASGSSAGSASASAPATASTASVPGASPTVLPPTSQAAGAVTSAPPPAAATSAAPTTARPTPTRSATSAAPSLPSPSPTSSKPRPTGTASPTGTPSTFTPPPIP